MSASAAFVRGRLGIDHVLGLETLAGVCVGLHGRAMARGRPARRHFRVSHRLLLQVVSIFAEGHPLMELVADLYRGASTGPIVNEDIYPGIAVTAGVRQGCLAFGSLFAHGAPCAHFRVGDPLTARARPSGVACFCPWVRGTGPSLDAYTMASWLRVKPSRTMLLPLCSPLDVFAVRPWLHGAWSWGRG